VSRTVAALEREVGGALLERTSRQVHLTPLGAAFEARLRPAYAALLAARDAAITDARELRGNLRVGVTQTTDCTAVMDLADAFTARHPECKAKIVEIDFWNPYDPLRGGEIDVLCNWLAVDEPDLRGGPVLEIRNRVLMVGHGHRLAGRATVSADELAAETVQRIPARYPGALTDALIPPSTPSGQPIRRAVGTNASPAWSGL
jgi:DNA-binding transcriptional LysR family regulator